MSRSILILFLTGLFSAALAQSFTVTRSLEPNLVMPGETVTVELRVTGGAGTYNLQETLPAALRLLESSGSIVNGQPAWGATLAAGETNAHRYSAVVSCDAADVLTWRGSFEPIGTAVPDASLLVIRPLLRFEPLEPFESGSVFELLLEVGNPIARPVTLALTPYSSDDITVLGGETQVTLAANETRTVRYSLLAEGSAPGFFGVTTGIGSVVCEGIQTAISPQAAAVLPEESVRSTLTFEAAAEGVLGLTDLILALRLPADARYLAGSARLGDEPLGEEPTAAEGLLFFRLPRTGGLLTVELVTPAGLSLPADAVSLLGLTPTPEVLSGDPAIVDPFRRAVPLADAVRLPRERVGAIIFSPADGTVLRERDAVTVVADAPLDSRMQLFINDVLVPEAQIGQRVLDSGFGRQTFDYVAVRLQTGLNTLRLETLTPDGQTLTDSIELYFAGAAVNLEVIPVTELVTDSATPLLFDIVVTDAWGNTPLDGFITLEVAGATPLTPDANPGDFGYQLRTVNGRARLALQPLTAPGALTFRALFTQRREVTLFVGSSPRPWLVTGVGSAAVTLTGEGLRFGASAQFFATGVVLEDYLLTFAVNLPRAPLGIFGNPFETFPVPGASGGVYSEALSRDGVFVRLERDLSYVQYGDFTVGFRDTLFAISRAYTGLSAVYRQGVQGFFAEGYLVLAPTNRNIEDLEIPSDGTSFYRLPNAPIEAGSLRLTVIKRDAFDGTLILITGDDDPLVRPLQPLIDYTVDETLGFVRLSRPLPLTDRAGNRYSLVAGYRLQNLEDAERRLQAGVQAGYAFEGGNVRAGFYNDASERGTVRLVSVATTLEFAPLRADLEVAYGQDDSSGGVGLAAGVVYSAEGIVIEGRYQYLSPGYRSVNVQDEASTGSSASLRATVRTTPALDFSVSARFSARPTASDYLLEALGQYRAGTIEGLGTAFLRFGVQLDNAGAYAVLGGTLGDAFGLEGFGLGILHRQGLGAGVQSSTDFTVSYRLMEGLELTLTDRLVWGESNAFILGLTSSFTNADLFGVAADWGSTQVRAQYELPGGVGVTAGTVRLGVSTALPVTEDLSVDVSIESALDLNDGSNSATVVALGGRYDTENLDAQARYEVRFADSVRHYANVGVTAAFDEGFYLSVRADYLFDPAATPMQGFRLNLAGAYRGDWLSVLTNHTANLGAYDVQGGQELTGDTRFSVPIINPGFDLRVGYAYRYREASGYQDIISLGASAGLWEGGNLSAFGRLYHDWRGGEFALSATFELAQRLGCGTYGVIGYSFGGFGDPMFGHNGLQLRLDAVLDEQWHCTRGDMAGYAFVDLNRNGVQDPDEPVMPGVRAELVTIGDTFVATSTTDAEGIYRFTGVAPGAYYLRFTLPDGYVFAPAHDIHNGRVRTARTESFTFRGGPFDSVPLYDRSLVPVRD